MFSESPIKSGMDIEDSKSKSPVRMGFQDPFINLKNMSIYHTIDEILGKIHHNKPFFYFEPVLVTFDESFLLNYENCLLCGAFANPSDLLCCKLCQENYHPFCLYSRNYNAENFKTIKMENQEWICPNCKICEKCGKPPENANNLFCHECERLYHLSCAYKNITIMPGSTWKCENCFA